MYLVRKILRIKNEVNHQWSEVKLCITTLTLAEFRATWSYSNNEYLVGHRGHCLYVKEVQLDGERLSCLNSLGNKKNSKPQIITQASSVQFNAV